MGAISHLVRDEIHVYKTLFFQLMFLQHLLISVISERFSILMAIH